MLESIYRCNLLKTNDSHDARQVLVSTCILIGKHKIRIKKYTLKPKILGEAMKIFLLLFKDNFKLLCD